MNEMDLHLTQTREFVDRAPVQLRFRRNVRQDDGAGGTRMADPADLDPQRVRVVGLRTPRSFVTSEGRQTVVEKAVVGLPGIDVRVGDYFTHGGRDWQVETVSEDPAWRTVAEASSRA